MIKLFYFRRRPNFGDLLSPCLIRSLMPEAGVRHGGLQDAGLVGAGSLLGRGDGILYGCRPKPRRNGGSLHVWGTGFRDPVVPSGEIFRYYDLEVHAVRGRLTEEVLRKTGYLRGDEHPALGDPGLLYPDLIPEWRDIPKTCEVAVVPHYYDQAAGRRLCARMKAAGVAAVFVDVSELDPLAVMRRIAGARKVLSSSLHGLIVADAMGIPNRRLVFGGHGRREAAAIPDFKFRDYYSAFGREQPPMLSAETVMRDPDAVVASLGEDDRIPPEEVEARKRALLDSFADCCDALRRKHRDKGSRTGSAGKMAFRKFLIPFVLLFGDDRESICGRLDEAVRFLGGRIELICVNCGSNDGTEEYIRYYASNDVRVRLSQRALHLNARGVFARTLVCLDWLVVRALLRIVSGVQDVFEIASKGVCRMRERRLKVLLPVEKVLAILSSCFCSDIRILMVRNPSPNRAGNEMFFVSVLQSILKPLGYRVRMSVREFWSPSRKYDIVHVHWPHMLVKTPAESITAQDVERVGKRIAELKASGTALVYTRHNETSHYCSNPNARRLYQLFEQESDRIIHMGRCSIGQVGGGAGERDVLIPHHGFDTYPTVGKEAARAKLGLARDAPVVAAMGSFRIPDERALVVDGCLSAGIPGLQVLSSALFTPCRGEPQDGIDELRRRMDGLYPGQPEGWVSVKDLSRSFAAADVVLIQHVHTLNSGNLPLGFHFGKVVVGPDCGNVGEILRETGNPVFDPRDEASVARALKEGFELARCGKGEENARYAREHWNFKASAEAHDGVYRAVLLQKGRERKARCPILAVNYADIPNMGDQLNPLIIGRMFGYGVVPVSANRAEIFVLGSCLQKLAKRKSSCRTFVWGTGFMSYDSAEPSPDLNVDYRAVRGNLTKRRLERLLGRELDIPTADPGLLASRLLDGPVDKEYDLGIIAHFQERRDPRFAQLAKLAGRVRMIDVTQDPLTVIRQIASCERILSSSLHGLIISDSLGIPNLHIKVTDNLRGDGFKFDDYYSAFGVAHEFVDLNKEGIESLEVISQRYCITPEAVATKQRQLLESFPFPRVEKPRCSKISPVALAFSWGLVRSWAARRFDAEVALMTQGRTCSRLKRTAKFMLPFGVVAFLRSRQFHEPMGVILSGEAFFRVLNWRW